jgi:nucleolin
VQPAAKKQRVEVNGGAAGGESSTVFVGNLPWSATEESLREYFAECGEMGAVRLGE